MPTIQFNRCVHLSHIIDERIPVWPGDPPVELQCVSDLASDGYFLRKLTISEHGATHVNAARTFTEHGTPIDAAPPESLVVPAVVIDVRPRAAGNPDYQLDPAGVQDWEARHGPIPAGSLVILYTGWQAKWDDPAAFLNPDERGLHFPGFRDDTTQFLRNHRQIAGVGIDTHGVDGGQDRTFATNRQVLANGGLVLENLTNLDQMPAVGATLVIGLLRLRGGSGSPAAVLAFVP
jgi:kynurenine formamidase